MGENGKDPTKREPKVPGRKQMTALWLAVVTALGSQGIPKIVEMLENKPDVEQVQAMIASQTEALTQAQHQAADVASNHDERLKRLERGQGRQRSRVGRLEGLTELLKEVLRDCCTRRQVRARLDASAASAALPKDDEEPDEADTEKPKVPDAILPYLNVTTAAKPAPPKKELLQKVPDFNVQQQLQIQEPPK